MSVEEQVKKFRKERDLYWQARYGLPLSDPVPPRPPMADVMASSVKINSGGPSVWGGGGYINSGGYMNEVVHLNIGGISREFTRGNLCQAKKSLLAKFFLKQKDHNLLHVVDGGKVFIDRDPYAFQDMMNYLANAE